MTGGVEDIGNFREGFCFSINTSDDDMWVVCSEALADKTEWMESVASVKSFYTTFTDTKQLEGIAALGGETEIDEAIKYD